MIIGRTLLASAPTRPWNTFSELMEAHGLERDDLDEWLIYWYSLSREEQAALREVDLTTL